MLKLRNRIVVEPTQIPLPQYPPSQVLETAEAPVRLYSDAAASRPPSAREENYLSPIEARDSRADEDVRPITDANGDTSEESEDGDPRWTTVRRGRAHSLERTYVTKN